MAMAGDHNKLPSAERTSASSVEARRWWQRWWLAPLAAFLAFLTVPGWYYRKYRRRRNAILTLSEIAMDLDLGNPAPQPWPFSLFGGKPSWTRRPVQEIDLHATDADDTVLGCFERIGDLPDTLWGLNLSGTRITDAGLVHVRELTQLQDLWLSHTQITDAGLANIEGMTRLEMLALSHTRITDAGLVYLKGMTELWWLRLSGTPLTDAGLAHLRGLTRLETLDLEGTQITGAGLAHLRTMPLLRQLYLRGTQLTDEGLVHLKGMPRLECVGVSRTRVTEDGAKSLKMSLRSGAGVDR